MSEKLWISLPSNEENALKAVINSITSKNLTNLSANQLIEKLENNQAASWLEIFSQYNAIPSINNMNSSEMLSRTRSVTKKFRQHGYDQLENREFPPNQLLSLVILCYSNPNLIGPKLCRALNDSNSDNIKKEILENSARVGNRVAPWASNLRLVNYALYANDTSVRLPVGVINRVKNETIQQGLIVQIIDQRGGFEEVINGPERAAREGRSIKTELDSYQILQSLQLAESDIAGEDHTQSQLDIPASASQMGYSGNGSELVTEALPLNSTNNAGPSVNLNPMLIMGVTALAFANRIPVISAVGRNIIRSVKDTSKKTVDLTTSFFSSVKPIQAKEERLEEQQPIFKTGCN